MSGWCPYVHNSQSSYSVNPGLRGYTGHMKKPVVVAVSGGFDPVHVGHAHLFRDARALGDKLVVILNDDAWLKRKKGYVFMPQHERKELLESIRWVDEGVIREPREVYDIAHML